MIHHLSLYVLPYMYDMYYMYYLYVRLHCEYRSIY